LTELADAQSEIEQDLDSVTNGDAYGSDQTVAALDASTGRCNTSRDGGGAR
jgi:hypothetical protein